MSAASRALILRRAEAALSDVPSSELPPDVDVPRGYRREHADGQDLVKLFAERVADYKATVVVVSPEAAAATLAGMLLDARVGRVVIPDDFPSDLLTAVRCTVVGDEPPLSVSELDAADGVVTTAAIGIAVTGTIVLDAGPGQGRRALTLLPDYHLCMVHGTQIVTDVPDALAALDPRRPLTWISGPSATSDIENDRVEGVHGPRNLDVLIIDDRGAAAEPPPVGTDRGRLSLVEEP